MAGPLQVSDVIGGKYAVERVLGQGGMGIVYQVMHSVTGKRLALKCLLPEFLHNPDLVERFVREAQATGRIQNRHVVDVFDVGRDGDVLYIVMELLDGKPLSELLHDVRLTLEETLAILVRAMEGVAAAHAHGIVHRDLKPDNIFVCLGASGRLDDPRVLDFGISKVDDGVSSLTRSGVAMGTPYYMAIEQLSGLRDVDVRVDVYAMGVILYEAIAGEPPIMADSVAALAIRLLTTPPVHLGELRSDLPEGLADVIMKAIARERENRFPTMQSLIDAVRPFVPRGSSLLVPEGHGRLLRTPRTPARVRSGVTEIAPTVQQLDPRFSSGLFADAASVRTAPPSDSVVQPPRSKLPLLVASAIAGALVAAGAVWFLRSGLSAVTSTTSAPPAAVSSKPLAVPEPPRLPVPEPQVAAQTTPPSSAEPDPAIAQPVAPAGVALAPSAEPPAGAGPRPGKGRAGKRGPDGEPVAVPGAAQKTPQNQGGTAAAPAPVARPGVTVTGRAGTLGSDDF